MKIATYNVNGVNGRLPRVVEWLEETQPDVVCLQEIKTDDTRFPAKPLATVGYHAVWHGQRAHHGVAILGRSGIPRDAAIYNASAWREDAVMQPESRDAWRRLLADGWIDATRALHRRDRIYTYWINTLAFRRNAGFRMDFLLLNATLAKRLTATGVDVALRGRERPSDHAAVWITVS